MVQSEKVTYELLTGTQVKYIIILRLYIETFYILLVFFFIKQELEVRLKNEIFSEVSIKLTIEDQNMINHKET